MLFQLLLLLPSLGGECHDQPSNGYEMCDKLVVLPELPGPDADLLARADAGHRFRPFAPVREQLGAIPFGSLPNELASRRAVVRLLRSLVGLVRLPIRWTADGWPDSFSANLETRLELEKNVFREDFELEYAGLSDQGFKALQEIARKDAVQLNSLVWPVIDAEMAAGGWKERLDNLDMLVCMQESFPHKRFARFRELLLENALFAHVQLVLRLLRTVAVDKPIASHFLQAEALDRLTRGRRFKLTLKAAWCASPMDVLYEQQPAGDAPLFAFDRLHKPNESAHVVDGPRVRIHLRRVTALVDQLEARSRNTDERTLVVDAPALAVFAFVAYVRLLQLHPGDGQFARLTAVDGWVEFVHADVMLLSCEQGFTTDIYQMFRLVLSRKFAGDAGLQQWLAHVEHAVLLAWNLSEGFSLNQNVMLGRLSRLPLPSLPALPSAVARARPSGFPPLDVHGVRLEHCAYEATRTLLAKCEERIAEQQVSALRVGRISLAEFGWLATFTVMRAAAVLLRLADGRPYDRLSVLSQLTAEEFRKLFDPDASVPLDEVAAIAADGFLQPAAVHQLLGRLLVNRRDFYEKLSAPFWSLHFETSWPTNSGPFWSKHLEANHSWPSPFTFRPGCPEPFPVRLPSGLSGGLSPGRLLDELTTAWDDWLVNASDAPEQRRWWRERKALQAPADADPKLYYPVLLYLQLPYSLEMKIAAANQCRQEQQVALREEQVLQLVDMFDVIAGLPAEGGEAEPPVASKTPFFFKRLLKSKLKISGLTGFALPKLLTK